MKKYIPFGLFIILAACGNETKNSPTTPSEISSMNSAKGSFGYDLGFLKKYHPDLVVLGDSGNAQVIIAPAYQGRVMTSTAEGNKGQSFGWINYDLVASAEPAEHMNAFGGEDRFWLGPEGGQFSIFFKKGSEFRYENWFVPKEIDTEPFTLVSSNNKEARFEKEMHLVNYSGTAFDLKVNRDIRILDIHGIRSILGVDIPAGIKAVAFESENRITNGGNKAWDKKSGMLSIWILSMMNASDKATVAVPFKEGDTAVLGKIVTDDYFGKVPAERLKIIPGKDKGTILFKTDANYRSKIGVSPQRALPYLAAYDAVNNVLTISSYTLPEGETGYVNSLWQLQEHPFSGDAVNSYNDGPVDGKQMGRFFEVESSSPAAPLKPGSSIKHIHQTIHLKGSKADLDKIAEKLLGISVDKISL